MSSSSSSSSSSNSSKSPVYSSNARTRQEHPIYNTLSSGDSNGGGGNGVDVGVGAGAGWSYVSKGERSMEDNENFQGSYNKMQFSYKDSITRDINIEDLRIS
ncbi:hypothetical protein HZH68_003478 [Vespula germanica]|uniref:Uncharacterized protein n=1 Tax=Vespula germanica TaxID=30212 RepID=A0A834U389_VESGE|nr:hypothetical protein HZH68_003478 [Vespula germanica]